jgi:HEAT repeat protein
VSLSSINIDQATEALLQILDESKEDRTKIFILRCFSRRHSADPKVRDKLREFTAPSKSLGVRLAALDQLGAVADEGAAEQFIAIYRSAVEQSVKERCLRGLASSESKPARDFLMATAKNDSDPEMRRTALRVMTERVSGNRRPVVDADGPATDQGDLDAMPGPASIETALQAPNMKLILCGQCLRRLLTAPIAENPTGGSARRAPLPWAE